MRVSGYRGADEPVEWEVSDEAALEAVLQTRDDRGGNAFYCAVGEALYPGLAIEVSGELAAIHYLPDDGAHAGFRCLATAPGLDPDGTTTLVFSLCDPRSGVETMNCFVAPFSTALLAAKEFLATGKRPSGVKWFEL